MLKWIGGIVSSIVAGLIVWWVISQLDPVEKEKPIPKSFLEKLYGSYRLESWEKASGPIELGVSVKDGTLSIDENGEANWNLGIWDSAKHPATPAGTTSSRIKCGGRVSGASQQLRWVSGGKRNVAIDWERGIDSVRKMVWPTFCGGRTAGPSAPFSLHLDEPSNEPKYLEMTNTKGTFLWLKTSVP